LLLLTAITDGSGGYVFKEVEPGDYASVEFIRDRFPSSLSDYDNSRKSEIGDSDTKINNLIAATLKPGKDDEDNNLEDDYGGAISGTVRNDQGNPLANVMLELYKGSSLVDFVFTNA
jgi:protocatechuate 3,4-dioxygenase beta subunit